MSQYWIRHDFLLDKKVTQMSSYWMQTYTGKRFDLLEPKADMVCLEDIAVSLSRQCRFVGHSIETYTVAEHSVRMSQIVPEKLRMAALLHDGHEAYLGDWSRPVKRILARRDAGGILKIVTGRIQRAIHKAFGVAELSAAEESALKYADDTMLATEKRDVMGESPDEWAALPEPLGGRIMPWCVDSRMVAYRFQESVEELM